MDIFSEELPNHFGLNTKNEILEKIRGSAPKLASLPKDSEHDIKIKILVLIAMVKIVMC